MRFYILIILTFLILSCKEKGCIKSEPIFKRYHVYEFNFNGEKTIHIAPINFGIVESNWGRTYVVCGIEGCEHEIVAYYPVSQTRYRIIKDTILEFHQCVEWK